MGKKIGVIGGLGRIGLVISAVLSENNDVEVYDVNKKAIEKFKLEKKANFFEPQLNSLLQSSCPKIVNTLSELLCNNHFIFITIGTSVDKYLNPDLKPIFSLFREIKEILLHLGVERTFIISSTVYPGVTKKIQTLLGKSNPVVFCPERMSTGSMIEEFKTFNQIVSANNWIVLDSVCKLFEDSGIKTEELFDTTNGELAKLFTNAYRYISFSISNYFYMLCDDMGCDFYDIYDTIKQEYPRMKDFYKPLYTGGSCLIKDTLQLASVTNSFQLGYAAYRINEHLPLHIFRKVRSLFFEDLKNITVGILGMAFKGNTDDNRDSLAYRLRNLFSNECKKVICSDPFIEDPSFLSMEEVISNSDVIIIGAYHDDYLNVDFRKINVPIIDVFNQFKLE